MAERKFSAISISTDWAFHHMNSKTIEAIKGCQCVYQDIVNDRQVFLFDAESQANKSYDKLKKIGADVVKHIQPAYIDEKYFERRKNERDRPCIIEN